MKNIVWCRNREQHVLRCRFARDGTFFMVITFVGHSDYRYREEDEKTVLTFLEETVGNKPCEFFLGGYGAFDSFAKKWCIEYKKTHPNVKLTLVIPYLNREYNAEGYDGTIYPPIETVPKRLAISRRNAFMVGKADYVIAYVLYCGGARNTLDIAVRENKKILNLADWH